MVPFAITGIVADQIYLKGVHNLNLTEIRAAKIVFPFEKEILVAEALFTIRNKNFTNDAYLVLKDALNYDPYSAEILGIYIQYEYHLGNKQIALMNLNKLEKITPNNPIIIQLKDILAKGL